MNDVAKVGMTVHVVVPINESGGRPFGRFECRAAIITKVNPEPNPEGLVSLVEFGDHDLVFSQDVPNMPGGGEIGTWHVDWAV